jgi:hypothetical protein
MHFYKIILPLPILLKHLIFSLIVAIILLVTHITYSNYLWHIKKQAAQPKT